MDKPVLSNRAFLYIDMDKIDYEKDILNIFERVMYKGSLDDFMALVKFYGKDRIRDEIICTKCFGPKEINFCCFVFKLKPDEFKYYKEGQFRAYPEFKDCPADFEYPRFA